MKKLIRGWIVKLKRRRIHREMRAGGNYGALERSIRAEGNVCSNCNVTLTGPYCHICGQKDDDLDRPIWTLLREILDDTFSTDSRLLKTLFLLVLVPGGLTRAFRMGRRARFVPPLRLYFVVSIMFFLMISVADILILDIHVTPEVTEEEETDAQEDAAQPSDPLTETAPPTVSDQPEAPAADTAISQTSDASEAETDAAPDQDRSTGSIADMEGLPPGVQEELRALDESGELQQAIREIEALGQEGALSPDPQDTEAETPEQRLRRILGDARFESLPDTTKEQIRNAVPGERLSIDGDEVARALLRNEIEGAADDDDDVSRGINISIPYEFDVKMFVKNADDEREGFKQEDIDKILNNPRVPQALKRATESFASALKEPQEFNELFNDWLPRALFVLMPFFALLLRVFHWRRDQRYLQQIVFALHFHTFLFLLLAGLMIIVPRFGGEMGFGVFWWGTSLYLIIALKVGQGQGWIRAFLKAGFVWVGYFIVMTLTMLTVVFVGLGDIDLIDLARGNTADFEIGSEAPAPEDGQGPEATPEN